MAVIRHFSGPVDSPLFVFKDEVARTEEYTKRAVAAKWLSLQEALTENGQKSKIMQ